MLHRKIDGKLYSVFELKALLTTGHNKSLQPTPKSGAAEL